MTSSPPEIPDRFICPITHEIMREPVLLGNNQTARDYERSAIQRIIADARQRGTVPRCPLTRIEIPANTPFNLPLRNEIREWLEKNQQWNIETFMKAAAENDEETVDEQLFFGIKATVLDAENKNILHHAAEGNAVGVLRLLAEKCTGEQLSELLHGETFVKGYSPLHVAAKNYHVEFYRELLHFDANDQVMDANGNSPLMLAINLDPERACGFVQAILKISEETARTWIDHCLTSLDRGLCISPIADRSAPEQQSATAFSIESFLEQVDQSHLLTKFVEEDIVTVSMLRELTQDDLKDLGITSLGARKKFLLAVKEINDQDSAASYADRIQAMHGLVDFLFKGNMKEWNLPWSIEMKPIDVDKLRRADLDGGIMRPLLLTILDAINRSLPVTNILIELQQKFQQFQAISAKNLLCALFYLLPHEKLYGVVQRLSQSSEMCIPLITPSFAQIPKNDTQALAYDSFLKDHVLNTLSPSTIIGSVRLSKTRGQSSFLNALFSTTFDVNCSNAFHNGSVDIVYDSQGVRGAHIVDLHGSLEENLDQAQLLSHMCSLLLIHVTPEELILLDDRTSKVSKLIEQSRAKILVIVRDALEEKVMPAHSSYNVVQICKIAENRDTQQSQLLRISKTLHPFIHPRLPLERLTYWDLEVIAKRFHPRIRSFIHSDGVYQTVFTISKGLQKYFAQQNPHSLFPFTALITRIAELEDNQEDSVGTIQQLKGLTDADLHPLLHSYCDAMMLFPESAMLLIFIVSGMISLYKKPVVDPLFRERDQRVKYLRDNNRRIENDAELNRIVAKLTKLDFGIEHLWREFISIHIARDQYRHERVIGVDWCERLEDICVQLMRKGVPMEIINGDSKTLCHSFLQKVLRKLHNHSEKPVFILSIAGPQSTGKSTLLNFLFGAIFPVRAGRCSRGLFATWIQTTNSSEPNILILDSEGLFSIERNDPVFDKQMMLICLASSNLMLLNVQGNFNESQKGVFSIAVSSIKLLELNHLSPKYRIILRDIGDRNFNPVEVKEKIMQDFADISATLEYKIDDIVRTDGDSQFITMCPAFNSVDMFVNGKTCTTNQASSAFSRDCSKLKHVIADDLLATRSDQSAPNIMPWFDEVKTNWVLLKKYGALYNFADFKAYVLQQELDATFHIIYSELSREFTMQGDVLIADMARRLVSETDIIQLDNQITRTLLELYETYTNKAVDAMEQLRKLKRFPQDSLELKRKDLLNILEKDHKRLVKQWTKRKSDKVKKNEMAQFKQELKQWVEDHAAVGSKTREELIQDFDRKANAVRVKCASTLKHDNHGSEDKVRKLVNDLFEKYIHSAAGKRLSAYVLREKSSSGYSWEHFKQAGKDVWKYICGKSRSKPCKPAQQQVRNMFKLVEVLPEQCVIQYPNVEFAAVQYVMESLYKELTVVVRNHGLLPNFDEELVRRLRQQMIAHYISKEKKSVAQDLADFDNTAAIYKRWFVEHAAGIHETPRKVQQVSSLFMRHIEGECKEDHSDQLKQQLRQRLIINNEIDTPESFDDKCFHHMNDAGETNEARLCYYLKPLDYQKRFFEQHKSSVLPVLLQEFDAKWSVTMRERRDEMQNRVAALKELFRDEASISNPGQQRVQDRRGLFNSVVQGLAGALEPFENASASMECLSSGTDYQAVVSTLIQDEIPNFPAFMDCLEEQLRSMFQEHIANPPQFIDTAEEQSEELFTSCRGCLARCPYCGSICTYHKDHEGQHHTDFHKFQAYSGMHYNSSKKAVLALCNTHSDEWIFGYGSEKDKAFPRQEHLRKYHNDWKIPISEERRYESIMKGHWKRIGRQVCAQKKTVYHENFGADG